MSASASSDAAVLIAREKLAQAGQLLQRLDLDAWLVFVRETSLSKDPALELIYPYELTWHSAFLVQRDGASHALVGRHDANNVERLNTFTTVSGYDQSIRPMLVELLRRSGAQRIAINFSESDPAADGLTSGMRMTLEAIGAEAGLQPAQLVSAESLISSLRGQKSASELQLIRQAVATTELLLHDFGKRIAPGVTELQLADYLHQRLQADGLATAWDWAGCPIVNTGPDSVMGHGAPSQLRVQPGHLVHVDFGVKQNGFCSDLQRMWYVLAPGESEPPAAVLHVWKIVRGALLVGLMALKPGVTGWEVDSVAREYLTRHGLPEYMHAYGHNVGRVAHDGGATLGPRWERYGKSPFVPVEAGNVFAIELGAQVPGHGWIYLEENALVTDDGAELVSTPQTELYLVRA